ncbi:hypothetical protein [Ruegeria sp. ANG-R]|uniref:hypothetical protein n=1 Tax=Ruegeria sp. ANG-R TaxID=1577903 RepID=UPI00126A2700|nr:hypothetical protein [Ruegeria sp. ANG-R]
MAVGIANISGRELNSPHRQRFFFNPDIYPAPGAPLKTTMLLCASLGLNRGQKTNVVDQQSQRASLVAIQQNPTLSDQTQHALNEINRLSTE